MGQFRRGNNTINVDINGANKTVKTFDLFNPNEALPSESPAGWKLLVTPPQPDDPPFEKYMVRNVFLVSPNGEDKVFISKDGPCELRALGFSQTGKSLVVALSCEIIIWTATN